MTVKVRDEEKIKIPISRIIFVDILINASSLKESEMLIAILQKRCFIA